MILYKALQQGKFFFDDIFFTGWLSTPVHFSGEDFDGSNIPSWVNIVFTPYQTNNASIGPKGKKIYATFTVVGWAENDVDAMDLTDQIRDFMDEKLKSSIYTIKQTSIIDHGWDNSGKVYTITQFAIVYYSGSCSEIPTDCIHSVGGLDGRAYYLDEPWLPDCTMFKV